MQIRSVVTGIAAAVGIALAGVVAAPTAGAAPAPPTGCPQIETIAVRGSTEAQGGGSIAGPQASSIQSRSAQTVRTHDLVYPASLGNYASSVRQGVSALRSRLAATSAQCPSTRFVLIGYSQGAQVIGDTLAAGGVPGADRIPAVLLFGDPTFNGRESYNTGSYSAARNGVFARSRGTLSAYASSIRSYCNATDNFCQRGATGSGHYRYASDRTAATTFAVQRIGG
ncbi:MULTISPECIES: cutinase family protein [unclassified Pseudonocardia]|uniref:cutinase family protein n=1 Tax=unclassified Pseudonocardia TaxID=2619320 RepID=UPI001CF6DE63|nr:MULTISPECIES: cutinase family protein [unclassified Pseudonocardia]